MANLPPKWAVAVQVSDPLPLVAAFLAHYLSIGASEIHVFLDGDQPDVEAFCKKDPRILTYQCNLKFFQNIHGRKKIPSKKTFRQGLNATYAAQITKCDWVLHVDVDEFLLCVDDFLAELSATPDSVDFLSIPNLERAYIEEETPETIWDGAFKFHVKPYSPADRLPFSEFGFFGYYGGKAISRAGRGLNLTIHRALVGARDDRQEGVLKGCQSAFLLHYDGMTPKHWVLKLLRRTLNGAKHLYDTNVRMRLLQILEFSARTDDFEALIAFARDLQTIPKETAKTMLDEGLLISEDFSPKEALEDIFGQGFDWSAAAFDQSLRDLEAEILLSLEKDLNFWRAERDEFYNNLYRNLARKTKAEPAKRMPVLSKT